MKIDDTIEELKKYFNIKEMVCSHVYKIWGDKAWYFFDEKLLDTLLAIRKNINVPITINTWASGGNLSQRGLRCNLCSLVKDKKNVYLSAHILGKAVDMDLKGFTALQARQKIEEVQNILPWPIRLEKGVNWVHLDVRNFSDKKVIYF